MRYSVVQIGVRDLIVFVACIPLLLDDGLLGPVKTRSSRPLVSTMVWSLGKELTHAPVPSPSSN